jgi:hypothetical protein
MLKEVSSFVNQASMSARSYNTNEDHLIWSFKHPKHPIKHVDGLLTMAIHCKSKYNGGPRKLIPVLYLFEQHPTPVQCSHNFNTSTHIDPCSCTLVSKAPSYAHSVTMLTMVNSCPQLAKLNLMKHRQCLSELAILYITINPCSP